MKFLIGSALIMASSATAQYISPLPPVVSPTTLPVVILPVTPSVTVSVSVSITVSPSTISPTISPSTISPATTVPPPSSVTGTVTDLLTSTYCDKCEEVYTTIYPVTYVDLCPTGTTQNVYTVTETCTGNSASFTPTSCPEGFTTYTTECPVCDEKTITVTAPVSTATSTEAGPTTEAPAPPAYTAPPPPKVKPAGTTVSYPPASTTGPQLVTVNAAAGSNVEFFTLVVGVFGAVFAGMVML